MHLHLRALSDAPFHFTHFSLPISGKRLIYLFSPTSQRSAFASLLFLSQWLASSSLPYITSSKLPPGVESVLSASTQHPVMSAPATPFPPFSLASSLHVP